MTRVKYWLRWFAVLPGALVGGVLMTFPLHWILYNTLTQFIEPYPTLPERILTPFVIALGFVAFGARIAPARKTEVALILFGLWMVLLGGAAAFILLVGHIGNRQFFFHGGGVASAGAFAGGVVGFLIARKEAARARPQPDTTLAGDEVEFEGDEAAEQADEADKARDGQD